MTLMELVRHRRSVRTFDGKKVSQEALDALLEYAHSAANPYDLPITWKILDAKESGLSSPVIAGTDLYIAGKLAKGPHAEEAFGYSFEKIVLKAEEMGLGTTWIAGTMDRDAFEKAMELSENEVMPCVSPIGYPAAKMSFKETMMRKGVRADYRMPFNEVFFEGSFDTPLSEERAGALFDALEMVRRAPSAVNKQPWRLVVCPGVVHFYEKKSRGYTADGWDVQKIDMGIALSHFALAMGEDKVSLVLEDPGLSSKADCFYIGSYKF